MRKTRVSSTCAVLAEALSHGRPRCDPEAHSALDFLKTCDPMRPSSPGDVARPQPSIRRDLGTTPTWGLQGRSREGPRGPAGPLMRGERGTPGSHARVGDMRHARVAPEEPNAKCDRVCSFHMFFGENNFFLIIFVFCCPGG